MGPRIWFSQAKLQTGLKPGRNFKWINFTLLFHVPPWYSWVTVQSMTHDTALSPNFQVNKHSKKLIYSVCCQQCQTEHSAAPLKSRRHRDTAVVTGPLVQGCLEFANHQQAGFSELADRGLISQGFGCLQQRLGSSSSVQLSKIYFLAESQVKYQTSSEKPSATFTF